MKNEEFEMCAGYEGTYGNAHRIYSKHNKQKETEREKAQRLAKQYSILAKNISNLTVETPKVANAIISIRNEIKTLQSDSGSLTADVMRLQNHLSEKVIAIRNELEKEQANVSERIEQVKNDTLVESPQAIRDVMAQADTELLNIMLRLKKTKDANRTVNRRIVGDILAHASRPQAVAIGRLSLLPEYSDILSEKQREKVAELSKSKAQVIWDKQREQQLDKLNKHWSEVFMKSFMLRKAEKMIDWI